MRRVATGELAKRLRNGVTDELTENPERWPLGVLPFPASSGKGLRAAGGCSLGLRAPDRRSNSATYACGGVGGRDPLRFSGCGPSQVNSSFADRARSEPSHAYTRSPATVFASAAVVGPRDSRVQVHQRRDGDAVRHDRRRDDRQHQAGQTLRQVAADAVHDGIRHVVD
jgi:hypothetical protein